MVCKDSRNAVKMFYPASFGSGWYPSKLLFNFSLDTLYLDKMLLKNIPLFFTSLSAREEMREVRRLALDEIVFRPLHHMANWKMWKMIESTQGITRIRSVQEEDQVPPQRH